MSIKEIDKVLSLQNNKVRDNVSIVTSKELGMDYLLRIDDSLMTRKTFTPKIAHSQASSEDRTIPRVVGSPYLLGCLIAVPYINPVYMQNRFTSTGYYIHSIEFEYSLKPNNKLVYDAKDTNELWLITYNEETIQYKAKKSGEIILNNYTVYPSDKEKETIYLTEYYVNVIKNDGIFFNEKHKLEKGYYSITYEIIGNIERFKLPSLSDDKNIKIKNITKEEFESSRKKQTSLEDFSLVTHADMKVNSLKNW